MHMYTRSRYKQCTPEYTVRRILNILSTTGIQTEVEWFVNIDITHSCRVRIINNGLKPFDIGTNGKGMTKEYALASAYGELMERLQNKSMFREGLKYASPYCSSIVGTDFSTILRLKKLNLNFLYFPDESFGKDGIYAPFEELTTGETEKFPVGLYRAMCGSTGLCAGNSRAEALCQGLNEIMERKMLWYIFEKQPNPSHLINVEELNGHEIYWRIKKLEENFEVSLHDWSYVEGWPVVGMLLMRKIDKSYTYRLAADFNIITAIERCYTETFQGKDVLEKLLKKVAPNYNVGYDDYVKCKRNGTGVFPYSLTCFSRNPQKQMFPHQDFLTYEEELNFYISLLKEKGLKVYMRDNSFLGFPAYAVYIPTVSNINISPKMQISYSKRKATEYTQIEARYNLKKSVANNVNTPLSSNPIQEPIIHLNPWNNAPSSLFYTFLAETLLAIAKKKWKYAIKTAIAHRHQMEKLGVENLNMTDILINVLSDIASSNEEFSEQSMELRYGTQLVHILQIIKNPAEAIGKRNIPNCFNCSDCTIVETCYFQHIIGLEKHIQSFQIANL